MRIDPLGTDWVIEEGVRCVVCPHCAFTFDAIHTDTDTPEGVVRYTCPLCDEGEERCLPVYTPAEYFRLLRAAKQTDSKADHD